MWLTATMNGWNVEGRHKTQPITTLFREKRVDICRCQRELSSSQCFCFKYIICEWMPEIKRLFATLTTRTNFTLKMPFNRSQWERLGYPQMIININYSAAIDLWFGIFIKLNSTNNFLCLVSFVEWMFSVSGKFNLIGISPSWWMWLPDADKPVNES